MAIVCFVHRKNATYSQIDIITDKRAEDARRAEGGNAKAEMMMELQGLFWLKAATV
jgi:hypothetical protein